MRLIKREELKDCYTYICDGVDKLKAVEKLYHYEEIADEPKKVVAIDRVLEIIDEEDQNRRNELGVAFDSGSITVADRIRNRVLDLKGGEQV